MSEAYRVRKIAQEGLKRHALVDQCVCDRCVKEYGPDGAPGRCGKCCDSQHGTVCTDRSAYLAIITMLDAAEAIQMNHRQLEDCPYCANQFCNDCNRVVRRGVIRHKPPTICPSCRGFNLSMRGVKHISPEKAADHRLQNRVEQSKERMIPVVFWRLPNGQWGIKGSNLIEGGEVDVTRRDGEEVTVTVDTILDSDEYGVSVARIRPESRRA